MPTLLSQASLPGCPHSSPQKSFTTLSFKVNLALSLHGLSQHLCNRKSKKERWKNSWRDAQPDALAQVLLLLPISVLWPFIIINHMANQSQKVCKNFCTRSQMKEDHWQQWYKCRAMTTVVQPNSSYKYTAMEYNYCHKRITLRKGSVFQIPFKKDLFT